jgi:hypothetical protein
MLNPIPSRRLRATVSANGYEGIALLLCVLLGLAMILNTQLGGESMWFWYATYFKDGAKLYSGLHIALQPYFVLETATWMRLFGNKSLVYEIPSVLHLLALCAGLYLVLRESDWRGWQKGILLAGAFILFVGGNSYRFDDYHVIAEGFILYAFVLLLWLARPRSSHSQYLLVAALGALSGLTITCRLTDGAALLAASAICLPFLLRGRRATSLCLLFLVAALTALLVVKLTGDTLSAYVSNSIIEAAGSKGGTGSIFSAPFLLFSNAVQRLQGSGKKILFFLLFLFLLGPSMQSTWRRGLCYLFPLQLGVAAVAFLLCPKDTRWQLETGSLIIAVVLALLLATYLVTPLVAAHFAASRLLGREVLWNPREVLVVVPLAVWASNSAGAGAAPLTNYYAPIAMLLLLIVVIVPAQGVPSWVGTSLTTVLLLIAVSGFAEKILIPYSWQNYVFSPMFQNRQWYRHPVYGPLYIDRDLLHFNQAVCADIGDADFQSRPKLLSLPYPFANYFCVTPPWHGYVQTFFDTSTRPVIEHLMEELNTAPPQWILYQRQLDILTGSERLYNHGQPLAQRDLDTLIMHKLDSGQWKLIEKRDYLKGDGWWIIQTHP